MLKRQAAGSPGRGPRGLRGPVRPAPRRSRGFSMIEALVAMVVISVGLLGVAALQAKSLQFTRASYQRSLATLQANDLVERLWAGACALPTARDSIRDEWRAAYGSSLPGWVGELGYDSTAVPPRYTITIQWTDPRIKHTSADTSQATQVFTHAVGIPALSC